LAPELRRSGLEKTLATRGPFPKIVTEARTMPAPHTSLRRLLRPALGLAALLVLAGAAPGQADDDAAIDQAFASLLAAINAGSPASVVAYIPDNQTAYFKLKGVVDGHLTAEKAKKKLKAWFDAGGKGPGWKQKGQRSGLTCRYKRSDGRNLTITLRKVGTKYYLSSITERG
jgi:hypothetical protein